jgi:hypothetical protein
MTPTASVGRPVAARHRVEALLGYQLECRLTGRTSCVDPDAVTSPWDIWWLCVRAGLTGPELGLDPSRLATPCDRCRHQVTVLTRAAPVSVPAEPGVACGCMERWARAMRQPGIWVAWPALRTQVAMVKPGADLAAAQAGLQACYQVVHQIERQLTTGDTRRLYPDAYGADYIAELDRYLTSGPVHVLILVALPSAGAATTRIKAQLRATLGAADAFRNHLHMPDNPGETLCDINHLAGPDILRDTYEANDRDRTNQRLARYRDVLALR